MLCEKCRYELKSTDTVCPNCGTPVQENVAGFENTAAIKRALRSMIDQYGKDIIRDPFKFIALLNDFIPEYEKERRLLKSMLQTGVVTNMLRESNEKIAIMKAKEYMINEVFLSENAAEFVMVCFTYILGWEYTPATPEAKQAAVEELPPEMPEEREPVRRGPIDINAKVLRPIDAARFRLRGNVKIPDGVTKIEGFAFDGYGFMRSVYIPDSVIAIGEYAFSECKHLKSVTIPESVKMIKNGAFSQCIRLTMAKLPSGLLEIADNTFSFCHALEIIEIPSEVSSIGAGAFSGCDSLKRLYLSDNVKFIEEDAFSYCPGLTIRCYENSYVHRYCLNAGIRVETVAKGTPFGK